MTPFTIVAIAFVVSLLLFGFAFWTPIYALPLVVLFLIAFGLAHMARRRRPSSEWRAQRDKAAHAGPHHETEFTERDRETLYEGH
jgi:membrane protein implicated in regulation of membrane protease activity